MANEYNVGESIKISQFLDDWVRVTTLQDISDVPWNDDFIANPYLNPEGLIDKKLKQPEFLKSISDTKNLSTLLHRSLELKRREENKWWVRKSLEKRKFTTSDAPWKHSFLNINPESAMSIPGEDNQKCPLQNKYDDLKKVAFPEVIITVHIYRPYKRWKKQWLEQEFEVLGTTPLSAFRDKIYCLADHVAVGDFNENPDIPISMTTKELYSSGFLFIEGTFYNDFRNEDSIDYSRCIKEWADERPDLVGPFSYESFDGVLFRDLTVRIGQPYLYMHQGNCEHLIIFTDIRMFSQDDCMYEFVYPLETFKSKERKVMCRACSRDYVGWVTYNSTLSPEDPCFFCDMCLKMLHYDVDGRLIDPGVIIKPFPAKDVK